MKARGKFIDFVLKEWLLVVSGAGFALTSLYAERLPKYSGSELQVLFILFALLVTVNGLQKSGALLRIAQSIEKGRAVPLKLVLSTFFLSMVVTNDIALIIIVPLTLSLSINRKDILVILEALAANSGSALTPIGNPQNLFIYWFYGISPGAFVKTIAPFSLVFLILLIVLSALIKTKGNLQRGQVKKINKKAFLHGVLLTVILLTVLRVFPFWTAIAVVIFAFALDRKVLRIDYALLFTFFFFFGVADNLKNLLNTEISHSGHIFIFSVLASQVMSNVPATLLFAKFTSDWQALLWGANAGGFGSLFGSLANLIAYKLYVTNKRTNNMVEFTAKFLLIGYIALFISVALYYLLYRTAFLL